jgi:hypothetical protein
MSLSPDSLLTDAFRLPPTHPCTQLACGPGVHGFLTVRNGPKRGRKRSLFAHCRSGMLTASSSIHLGSMPHVYTYGTQKQEGQKNGGGKPHASGGQRSLGLSPGVSGNSPHCCGNRCPCLPGKRPFILDCFPGSQACEVSYLPRWHQPAKDTYIG